jgi:hypothetical protein
MIAIVTPEIKKKEELMSFFWQAAPPHRTNRSVPSSFLTIVSWQRQA